MPTPCAPDQAMQSKVALLAGAGAATAALASWAGWRWWKYGVVFSPIYTASGVPTYRQIPGRKVYAGKVEGEDRGPNPMDPPKELLDELYWLRDDERKSRKVITHLNRENAYFEATFKPYKPVQSTIYDEFVSHMKETDEEVPYPHGSYFYYTRTMKGLPYRIHCRKKNVMGAPGGPEEIVLDVNLVGKGKSYCHVDSVEISPDHNVVAFSADYNGSEKYEILLKDLSAQRLLPDRVLESGGDIVWGRSNKEFFYTTRDSKQRTDKVWRHVLGTEQGSDECLFEEADELFWVGLAKTDSGRFIVVSSRSKTRSESLTLDLDQPGARLTMVHPREENHRYSVEHWGNEFFIITNADGCLNSKLVRTDIARPGRASWTEVMPYEETTKLDYLVCFKNHIVINGRCNGLKMCKVMTMETGRVQPITLQEEVFDIYSKSNKEFDSEVFRYGYSSLVTPHSTIDYNMRTQAATLLKIKEVPGYEPSWYKCERTVARARDGTSVPISLVYRKDCRWATERKPSPMMLYAYGSYGACIDPSFDFKCISYLDRGMIFAIAHIRGGGEMGRHWYEREGKYLAKKNTFLDFCDSAEHLIFKGYTTTPQLAISGRSAGGMLMGTVLNLRPDLFQCAVAGVPFVDVMTTMVDPSIPLTIVEWEEWGNPNEEKYFDYIKSYSPVDNVTKAAYPHLLVTAGLNDPRVAYWEPAKWVAKIRRLSTSGALCLLKTDMSSGHFAASDRYKLMEERSIEYAFVTVKLGCADLLPPDFKFLAQQNSASS